MPNPIPDEIYARLIENYEAQIDLEREFLSNEIQEALSDTNPEAALREFNKGRAGKTKRLYNLKESRHVLEVGRTYPKRHFFGQTAIVRIEAADGKVMKVFGRGELRITDFAEISGEAAELGDIKSDNAIYQSVKGRKSEFDDNAVFRDSSAIAKQHAKEAKVMALAKKHDAYVVLRAKDVARDVTVEVRIHHSKLRTPSRIVPYRFIHSSRLPEPASPSTPLGAGPPRGKLANRGGGASRRAPRTGGSGGARANSRGIAPASRGASGKGLSVASSAPASGLTRGVRARIPKGAVGNFARNAGSKIARGVRGGIGGGVRTAQSAIIWNLAEKTVNGLLTGDPDQSIADLALAQTFAQMEINIRLAPLLQRLDGQLASIDLTANQLFAVGRPEFVDDAEFAIRSLERGLVSLSNGNTRGFRTSVELSIETMQLTRAVLITGPATDPVRAGVPEEMADDALLFTRLVDQFGELKRLVAGMEAYLR